MKKPILKTKKIVSKKVVTKKPNSLQKKISKIKKQLSKEQKATFDTVVSDRKKLFKFLNENNISVHSFVIIVSEFLMDTFSNVITLREILNFIIKREVDFLVKKQKGTKNDK